MKSINNKMWLIFNFLLFSYIHSENIDMFLCVDSMTRIKQQSGQEQEKLVYGYINGKKTPCMTEYEFRTHYSQEIFRDTMKSVEATQQKTLQQNAAYRGEKNLSNADLRGLDLQGVDFSGADLRTAKLESADLRNAKFKNANLDSANLNGAYCKNADFEGANLSNTQLKGTFLQNANLIKTKGLTIDNLSSAASLYHTKLDETLYTIIEESYPLKLDHPKGSWAPKIFDTLQDVSIPKKKRTNKKRK